jgi:hypothetical protein
MSTKKGWLAALVAVGMAIGCGEGGGGNPGPSASPEQKTAAQTAGTGGSSLTQTQDAANDAIVESGAPGSTTAKTGVSKSSTAGTTINYQASVTVTVDLDMLNSSGQDMFPNASGQFKVEANGSVTGNAAAGQVAYDCHVTWLTPGVFNDPACGKTATVATSTNWNYTLLIQWAKTDDLNWSIQATSDVAGDLEATVTHGSKTWTVTGTVTRHASLAFSRTAGNYSFAFGINGQHVVVIDDGSVSHTVISTMSALDHVIIEIDGVAFGPFTVAQILWWFAFRWWC